MIFPHLSGKNFLLDLSVPETLAGSADLWQYARWYALLANWKCQLSSAQTPNADFHRHIDARCSVRSQRTGDASFFGYDWERRVSSAYYWKHRLSSAITGSAGFRRQEMHPKGCASGKCTLKRALPGTLKCALLTGSADFSRLRCTLKCALPVDAP